MDNNNFYQDNTQDFNTTMNEAPQNNGPQPANTLQIVGLIMGILSILFCCCFGIFGVIFAIVSLICAIKGNKTAKNGVGTAALVLSIIGLVLGVLATVYFLFSFAFLISTGQMDVILDQATMMY